MELQMKKKQKRDFIKYKEMRARHRAMASLQSRQKSNMQEYQQRVAEVNEQVRSKSREIQILEEIESHKLKQLTITK